ncbi:MAG TPA: D-2-hydroxyacid dehydrogenase family protein [Baekduia sp.]|nr:D-2-hydroxyacid dehydrogenase family protein [Baekduia sp.]
MTSFTPAERFRVAVLDDYQDTSHACGDWDSLDNVQLTTFNRHIGDDDELVALLADFHAIVLIRERTPLTRARLERLPKLKLVVTAGHFNVGVDLQATNEAGIVVSGTDYPDIKSTAELTWALVLALARGVNKEVESVRSGGWQRTVGVGLDGKTLGLLGLGGLGSAVASPANGFGMDLIAWSPNLTEERAREHGARLVSKDELMAESDFLAVCLVLSPATHHLVSAADLALMKPTAFLVNTSRGPIVDETALAAVLSAGQIAGAGLDAFDREPLPADHPFRTLPNVLATPHLGFVTEENYELFYRQFIEDIAAYLAGEPIRLVVPENSYVERR